MDVNESPVVFYENAGPVLASDLSDNIEAKCLGIRVFYFDNFKNGSNCDHSGDHNQKWRELMENGNYLEAGTVIGLHHYGQGVRGAVMKFYVAIQWDCGVERLYTKLENIRVFDLGPAGYKGEMVFCDKCLIPVMGFAWRLAKEKDSTGDLYDLCCTHYNENEDPHSRNHFYCNIPSGYIPSGESDIDNSQVNRHRPKINPRSHDQSKEYDLIGLFKNATVKYSTKKNEFKEGTVLKIDHKDKSMKDGSNEDTIMAQQDMRNADYYNCCAEIIPASGGRLVYRSAGAEGRIDVEVTSPGTWGTIFAAHHPPLSFELLREMATYKDHCLLMKDGNLCFMRRQEDGKCNSLTISGTTLQEVSKEVWDECQDLKIVILYMNMLSLLPSELLSFKETITLVCIQNNCFREFPQSLYEFTKLEHLNMHGNYLSVIPEDFQSFTNLQRLYLGDNDLISLPDVFNNFPHLEKASFKMNHLTRLPPSFADLKKLENLDISDNRIVKFPKHLLKLQSLKFLNIERNRIQRLTPPEQDSPELYKSTYSFFCQLQHLQLKGNPIQQHECLRDIKDHNVILEKLKNEEIFGELSKIELTRSLRVNVLGGSGAGKTSLVQALVLDKYVIPTTQKGHRHTVGIDRYCLPVDIGGKTILLHIWDHAGDDEYAMMNDLFISDQSLVWLVVNLTQYEPSGVRQDQRVFRDHIGHWLLQVMSHNLKPIVWIICTHTDASLKRKLKTDHILFWANELCRTFSESLTRAEKEHTEMLKTCCDQRRELEEKLEGIKELSKANVPQFLMDNLKIIEVTNTYGFKGFKDIHKRLDDLPNTSTWASSSLTSPLPIEWQKGMDHLQQHAEEEVNHLTSDSYNLPTILTKDVRSIATLPRDINAELFLEYHHDIGEIYLIKSSDGDEKSLAVLNLDWMISLLKEVYRHDFDSELDEAKTRVEFCSVKEEVLDDAKVKRERCGLISESILKLLWKCNGKDELFSRIVQLFQKFNLTYPTTVGPNTFYFFPYLRKSKLPEDYLCDCSTQRNHRVITLRYTFTFFFPRFFLQRLALQFWGNKANKNTKIYDKCFSTELSNGTHLTVTQACVNRPNQEEIKICFNSNVLDGLWSAVPAVLHNVHSVLSSYWKFHGDTEVYVMCPNCVVTKSSQPNYLHLLQFSDIKCCSEFQSRKSLFCTTCKKNTPVAELVPSRSHDLSQSHQICEILCVESEDDFIDRLSAKWEIRSSVIVQPASIISSGLWPSSYFQAVRSVSSTPESYSMSSESSFLVDAHQEEEGINKI